MVMIGLRLSHPSENPCGRCAPFEGLSQYLRTADGCL